MRPIRLFISNALIALIAAPFANGKGYSGNNTSLLNNSGTQYSVRIQGKINFTDGPLSDNTTVKFVSTDSLSSTNTDSIITFRAETAMNADGTYSIQATATGVNEIADFESESQMWAGPNPFNNYTRIYFNLAPGNSLNYTITIFNSRGQHVKRFGGVGVSGQNTVTWKGSNDKNAKIAAGQYYALLTTEKYQKTLKLLFGVGESAIDLNLPVNTSQKVNHIASIPFNALAIVTTQDISDTSHVVLYTDIINERDLTFQWPNRAPELVQGAPTFNYGIEDHPITFEVGRYLTDFNGAIPSVHADSTNFPAGTSQDYETTTRELSLIFPENFNGSGIETKLIGLDDEFTVETNPITIDIEPVNDTPIIIIDDQIVPDIAIFLRTQC
ncbi:MAG: T9SS C-terminal target domain-containing protein [Calditrichaeota bacterium]|nr:MAG: T9SS C-terminal target domain-containing protein [Calditrichota bacterium]